VGVRVDFFKTISRSQSTSSRRHLCLFSDRTNLCGSTSFGPAQHHNCPNRNNLYEWSHIFQSQLKQILETPNLLQHYNLKQKQLLDPVLLERLKLWVALEDAFIDDNSEALLKERT